MLARQLAVLYKIACWALFTKEILQFEYLLSWIILIIIFLLISVIKMCQSRLKNIATFLRKFLKYNFLENPNQNTSLWKNFVSLNKTLRLDFESHWLAVYVLF